MPTQEIQTVTKDTQKIVLKMICENPTCTLEELNLMLKSSIKKITQDEILQVIHSISPNKNWHRASQEDIQKEILDYIWTLEAQVLFLFPTKQKETTIAEFNQIRLQNKQSKAPKDLIRHIQTILSVDGKNLAKFRKFQKELSIQSDVDINIQASWLVRVLLANLNLNSITTTQDVSSLLLSQFKEKLPVLFEKTGKTSQRICERFIDKYFSKNTTENKLIELISSYQSIFNTYKKASEGEIQIQSEFQDQNKIIQNTVEQLKEVQEIVNESHEGGFMSKLLSGKVKNKEGIIEKINEVISALSQINDINIKSNKSTAEKSLLVQKLQSDYENIVYVKNQLESDLYSLNEKVKQLEENISSLDKELHNKTESLEKAHEKIALLQQKVDQIPNIESRTDLLREELSTAKEIALSLYSRVNKIKADLLKQQNEKPKTNKTNGEHKSVNGNPTIHKVQQNLETGETTITTEMRDGG